MDPEEVNVDDCFPEKEAMEPVVREAFVEIDPTGEVGEECWNNYSQKLEYWSDCRSQLERLLKTGPGTRMSWARWSSRRRGSSSVLTR